MARSRANLMLHFQRPFLQWPTIRGLWLEVRSTLQQFITQALPVFLLICVVASFAAAWGVIDALSGGLSPLMALFNLPAETAIPLVMASLRKDGTLKRASVYGTEGWWFEPTGVYFLSLVER